MSTYPTVQNWTQYPTMLISGNLIKTLPPPYTVAQLSGEANALQECVAFTTAGHLLSSVDTHSQWRYSNDVSSYVNHNKLKETQEKLKEKLRTAIEASTKANRELKHLKPKPTPSKPKNVVPKIVHQFYQSENISIAPKKVRNAISSNLQILERWDFRLYTPPKLKTFVEKEYPDYATVYSKLPEEKAAELAKLLILHKYGGAYFDISVKLGKKINNLIKTNVTAMFTKRPNNEKALTAMISAPNDPLIKELAELYLQTEQPTNDFVHRTVQNYKPKPNMIVL